MATRHFQRESGASAGAAWASALSMATMFSIASTGALQLWAQGTDETPLLAMRDRTVGNASVVDRDTVHLRPDQLRAIVGRDTACVPAAVGVPGVIGAAPRWWNVDNDMVFPEWVNDNVGNAAESDRFDDPRWNQAVSFTNGPGPATSQHVDFRALFDASNIYLSWEVKLDPLRTDNGQDNIWLALDQSGSDPPVAINIILKTTTPGKPGLNQQGLAVYDIGYYTFTGTWQSSPVPGWIRARTRVWVVTRVGQSWAIQMEIPRTSLNLGTEFNLWYQFLVGLVPTASMPSPVAQYAWPRQSTAPPGFFPPLSDWGVIFLGTPPAGANCGGDLAIYGTNIGTTNLPYSSQIKFTAPPAANSHTNFFYARPTSLRAAGDPDILAHTVTARFFLADWGSMTDEAGNWREISPTPPAAFANNNGPIAPGQTAHGDPSRNDIQFDWTLENCERYDYLPDPYPASCPGRTKRTQHQCVLVELSSPVQMAFTRKSAYRNMDFVTASSFSRDAAISVVGLPPILGTGTTRTVYLYVETLNLPAVVEPERAAVDTQIVATTDTTTIGEHDTRVIAGPARIYTERDSVVRLPADKRLVVRGPATIVVPSEDTIVVPLPHTMERAAVVHAAMERGQLSEPQVDALMPTYRVHAYYETGDTAIFAGVKHPLVRAQTSFGYWVDHKGALQGWKHRIEGAELIQLAPNFYKLAVPNNGVATVTTTIEALEPTPFALSLHGGLSLPHGTFSNTHDPGFGLTIDGKRRLNATFAAVVLLGYHRFTGAGGNADLDLYHASAGLEAVLTSGRLALLADAGGGGYHFSPGGTDPGAHAGLGLEFDVSPEVVLGVSYRVHTVFTSGSNTTFSSIQAGGRFRF